MPVSKILDQTGTFEAYCELDDCPWLLCHPPVDRAECALDFAKAGSDLREVAEHEPRKIRIGVPLSRQVAYKDTSLGRKPHLRLVEHNLRELDVVLSRLLCSRRLEIVVGGRRWG